MKTEESAFESLLRGVTSFFTRSPERSDALTSDEILGMNYIPFLVRMTSQQKVLFFERCDQFLKEVRFKGLAGYEPHRSDRIRTALSCALLYAGRPEWNFPPIRSVTISRLLFKGNPPVPDAQGNIAGFYRHHDLSVHLHERSLRMSFCTDEDGYHLGLHEFAHALDAGDGDWEGSLPDMSPLMQSLFKPVLEKERRRAGQKDAALRAYGHQDLGEAFATSIECFFENPMKLRRKAPELYLLLALHLNQNPVAFDEGLRRRLSAPVQSVVQKYMDELMNGIEVRVGKYFLKKITHMRNSYLHASYQTRNGKWSKPQCIHNGIVDPELPRQPKHELIVTVGLRHGKIRRVGGIGAYPPFVNQDDRHLKELLKKQLPKQNPAALDDTIRTAWQNYRAQFTPSDAER